MTTREEVEKFLKEAGFLFTTTLHIKDALFYMKELKIHL